MRRYEHEKKHSGCRRIISVVAMVLVLAFAAGGWFVYSNRNGCALTDADDPLVKTARKEIGNKGGEKFWSWYGFDYEVDWCGCFVSWCGDQNGYQEKDRMPTFCYVQEGLNWFNDNEKWKGPGYEPQGGELIFFDWNGNDVADHVGIVSGSMLKRVFTIEGNTKGSICKRRSYPVGSRTIMGYGIP
jgi:hypothetical protein